MTRFYQCLILILFLTLSCSCMSCTSDNHSQKSEDTNSSLDDYPTIHKKRNKSAIGVVTMKQDGTLIFDLREDKKKTEPNDEVFIIRPGTEKYDTYLKHVSPVTPGETKDVMPW